jgi:hypothetical protein
MLVFAGCLFLVVYLTETGSLEKSLFQFLRNPDHFFSLFTLSRNRLCFSINILVKIHEVLNLPLLESMTHRIPQATHRSGVGLQVSTFAICHYIGAVSVSLIALQFQLLVVFNELSVNLKLLYNFRIIVIIINFLGLLCERFQVLLPLFCVIFLQSSLFG